METVTWTDERIGALEKKVDDGFARMDVEFARMDECFKRVDERFEYIDRRFEDVDRRFDRLEGDFKDGFARMEAKFDALQRTMIQVGGGLIGTLIVALVTILATRL